MDILLNISRETLLVIQLVECISFVLSRILYEIKPKRSTLILVIVVGIMAVLTIIADPKFSKLFN
ncbi:hypothetical protein [Bacillus cereus group sp. BfR-BA-02730]|uniref:hypothetical protein n=1 Tax=Bacillus cereus group sp. BfR-BA-02730 TaxID=3094893 RepID=UPI0029C3576C|nr:hypothetical protein [Bacillus cereus group sp. BfR-BA-02730]MDX5808333.1 hypothetical protein [Bacillus cereus group sp. BfR-BA-02730]